MCYGYEDGCGICECMHIEAFKGELTWAIYKLQVISNTMLLKTVILRI